METLSATDVRVELLSLPGSKLRFLVGVYVDEYGQSAVSFLQLRKEKYQVINVPEPFKLSSGLQAYLLQALNLDVHLPLRLANGTYYDDGSYSSQRAIEYELDHYYPGQKIESVTLAGVRYDLFAYNSLAYIGQLVGETDTTQLWRSIPMPEGLSTDELDYLIGTAEMAGFCFVEGRRINRLQ